MCWPSASLTQILRSWAPSPLPPLTRTSSSPVISTIFRPSRESLSAASVARPYNQSSNNTMRWAMQIWEDLGVLFSQYMLHNSDLYLSLSQSAQLDTPTDDPEALSKPEGPCPLNCKVNASSASSLQLSHNVLYESSFTVCCCSQGQKGEKVSGYFVMCGIDQISITDDIIISNFSTAGRWIWSWWPGMLDSSYFFISILPSH